MMQKNILITSATIQEAEYLIDRLNNRRKTKIGNKLAISGVIHNKAVKIAITGPGIINAAHTATAAIEQKPPELIIKTGCAGGFKQAGLTIGDICIAYAEIDAQLGIEPQNQADTLQELPFPIYKDNKKEIKSTYPTDLKLSLKAEEILKKKICDNTKIMQGNFITVSTVTATDKTAKKYFKAFNCIAENMEGAAAAYIALIYGIPFIEIRAISNIVGKREKEKWDLKTAFKKAGQAVYEIIKEI
ncbi:MAG: futalosine hydrolase [Deltaproteobacteria bacterium]|nr:futalosine hydrolase [Deltaproteobacteria bacterium]